MIEAPQILREAIYENIHGFREYNWQQGGWIPANSKIIVTLTIPLEEIYLENKYEVDVDATNVMKISHYHDGIPQWQNLLVSEEFLTIPYVKHEMSKNSFGFIFENTDPHNPHLIKVTGFYRTVPAEVYEKVKLEISK